MNRLTRKKVVVAGTSRGVSAPTVRRPYPGDHQAYRTPSDQSR